MVVICYTGCSENVATIFGVIADIEENKINSIYLARILRRLGDVCVANWEPKS